MIRMLTIRNFKSIRDAQLDCARVNVFIGEPNSGKSNLLETIGMLSFAAAWPSDNQLRRFVRFERTSNLFYDELLDQPLRITCDDTELILQYGNGIFSGSVKDGQGICMEFAGDHDDVRLGGHIRPPKLFKYYKFQEASAFTRPESEFLLPPAGGNLTSLLLADKQLRAAVNDLLQPFALKLGIRPREGKIEAVKQVEDVIISYPYFVLSDTLQRVVFYMAAIKRNKESVIVFEEPEAHAFPYYTKYLAELIALDPNKNQYFISTHNPYFLLPLVEKAPAEDVTVFVTSLHDYQTRVRALSKDELQRLSEIDIFSNLDMFQGSA